MPVDRPENAEVVEKVDVKIGEDFIEFEIGPATGD